MLHRSERFQGLRTHKHAIGSTLSGQQVHPASGRQRQGGCWHAACDTLCSSACALLVPAQSVAVLGCTSEGK